MKVIEIFKSIDGEGIRAGFPVTFIRLEGCNLRCSYCDTKYSYEKAQFTEMTPHKIYDTVYRLGCKRVTLTGGEPLIHKDVNTLIELLTHGGFRVNIETNGAVDVAPYVKARNILITMDYKCPSSGMTDKMLLNNLPKLSKNDVLKFVVGSKDDLDACRDIKGYTNAQIFISPVFGQIEPKEIVEYMLEHDMQDCRIQIQMHKIIWEPDKRGV